LRLDAGSVGVHTRKKVVKGQHDACHAGISAASSNIAATLVDEMSGRRGLFLAFRHGHTGPTAGAPTGRLVPQLVTGDPPRVPGQPYSGAQCR
jgi:glycine/D-amino acid oxidase-like deaminating enzyme